IDATKKIKTSGFRKHISSWKDTKKDLFISTCLDIEGKQVRYDYKIIFYKSKFHSKDVEKIKKALNEINTLRDNLHFKVAVIRLDSAIKLANEMRIPKYMNELRRIEQEINGIEKDYNSQLDNLANSIASHRENNNIQAALKDCEKIIQITESIDRNTLLEKYKDITGNIMDEMIADKNKREKIYEEINSLENVLYLNRKKNDIDEAINNCEEILKLTRDLDDEDIFEKYDLILEDCRKQKIKLEEDKTKLKKELKDLDEKIKIYINKNLFEEALESSNRCLQISETLEDNVLIKKYKFISDRITQRKNETESIINRSKLSKTEFIELIDIVERLNKEGLEALDENKLEKSLEKYKKIKESIVKHIK
ncbi:MAG: hypothetical protein ACFFAO_04985, partial [Candidatus Hermodarchaeota archaeon]